MLQINAPALSSTGHTVAIGAIVSWIPNFGAGTLNPDGSRSFPVSFSWYESLANLSAGFDPTMMILDAGSKSKLAGTTVNLTVAESANPSQSAIENHIKTYLETIYGVGNVVII